MHQRGTEQTLRSLVGEGPAYVQVAQVTGISTHASWGYLLDLVVRPGGQELQARLLGFGEAAWTPVSVDDEVLVLLPDGDPNRAVALPGLPSAAAPVPSSFGNDHLDLVHSGGLEARTTAAATVQAVVVESLLGDLQTALTEIQGALAALGIPLPNTATFLAQLPTQYRSAAIQSE